MDHDDLHRMSARAADWVREYHSNLRERPVRSAVAPGDIARLLPDKPPIEGEDLDQIFADFEAIVPKGMSHWQHPRFFAYFPSDASPASMLAEQLANAISAMCMLWQTSPAATEIEEVMIGWMAQAFGLPREFTGTIHDSATVATLSAILTMRDAALGYENHEDGLFGAVPVRIYASAQTHSSVDKAIRVAGIGQKNLVKIRTKADHGMDPTALDAAIRADLAAGLRPAGVILCTGGTSIGAMDPIAACIQVAKAHGLPVHVDAAWAGNFMVCPEFRTLWAGIEAADSIVINPYKGLGVQFDGALQFLRDPAPQVRALGLRPAYLETLGRQGAVNDFNDWTVPLGRRFRALKLWFVMRAYGVSGLATRKRNHVAWCAALCESLSRVKGVEVATQPVLGLFSFALASDVATRDLLTRINDDGRVYLTQTDLDGRFVIRVQIGPFDCTQADVMMVETVLRELLGA